MIKPLLRECKTCSFTKDCRREPDGKMIPPKGKYCSLLKVTTPKKKQYVKKTVFMEIAESEEVKPEYWLAGSMIEIAEVLTEYMSKNKLNQSDVAKKLGVGRTCVSRILGCNTNPTLKTIIRLSMIVGIKRPRLTLSNLKKES